jgi:acyl-CoA synthetase (AMP-forming)/AMP-acid ligase II
MTTRDHPARAVLAARQRLLGPGGQFELVEETVLGTPTPVFAHRARSLSALLTDSLRHGDRDYVVTRERRTTFAEHGAQVAALARALREEHGVGAGDRVGIVAANVPEWIVTFWATVSLGAVAVGYNSWWSARELAYGVAHSRPRVVVADRKRAALLVDSAVPVLTMEEDLPRLMVTWSTRELATVAVAEDAPAVILYTSGTSGRPKGAVHTQRNLLSVVEFHRFHDALRTDLGDPTDPRERNHLLTSPLFHVGSLHNLAVPCLATGSRVTMHLGAFDVDAVMSLVERERVTDWGAVPTMAARLLEHPDLTAYDTSSLTAFALASAPSSRLFKERLRTRLPFGSTLVDSYGLTESCTAVTAAGPADLAEAPGTLGHPIPGVRLEIRDPFGEPVPRGEEGEICALSAYNMLGYWDDEAATRGAFGSDRWLRTGDLGVLDEEGRLRLSARRSDLVIRGGENVYPAEVEAVLAEHPDLEECLVHGVPHEDLGQEVAVVVVSHRRDHAVLEADLRSWAGTQMAHYKVPSRWRFTGVALPRNATGKVIRHRVAG